MSDHVFDPELLEIAVIRIKERTKAIAMLHVASMGYDTTTVVGQKMVEAFTAGYDLAMKDGFKFFENATL